MNSGVIEKKERILNAAYECFLQHGFKKTTFVDIVKKAGISRASLYLYFKNKEDLFVTMNKDLQDRYAAASAAIAISSLPARDKVLKIIDVWITDPYRYMKNTNYSNELLDGLLLVSKQTEQRFRDLFVTSIEPLVGKDLAEIIVFSMRGLLEDRPPVGTLQKRIKLLVNAIMREI